MSLFKIPGNIKQQLVPFVLNPSAPINQKKTDSTELASATPQLFTFRDDRTDPGGGMGFLNICPKSFKDYMADDISYKLIYPMIKTGEVKELAMSYQYLLNCIPGIQIREFLPDTRLDQCLNFFTDMMNTMTSMFTKDKDKAKDEQNKQPETNKDPNAADSFFTKLTKACNWALNYMTGSLKSESLMKDIQSDLDSNSAAGVYSSADASLKNYVINFPYILYYRFQSCVTTNIYEVPCQIDGNRMYSSDGTPGWTDGGKLELVNQFLGNVPMLGSLLKSILGNVRVNYLPWWDSNAGHGTAEPDVTIKFTLFNDTAEAAIYNFIFVNTLIPNNKWIQYNVFQHSSSLYDIKIEGCNRLFACSGKFDVAYKGVLRDPSQSMLNTLCSTYKNSNASGMSAADIFNKRIIKIPDVYEVSMTFQSLLPTNFNNWLFQYSENASQMEQYKGKAYTKSIAVDMMSGGIKKFTERLKGHWDGDSFPES